MVNKMLTSLGMVVLIGGLMAVLFIVGAVAAVWMLESNVQGPGAATSKVNGNEFVADLPEETGIDVVIQCNEEFFQAAYKKFREDHLDIDTEPIVVPGGIKALAAIEGELPKDLESVKRALVEALKRYSPRRVVLTAHSHCLIYDVIAAWQNNPEKVRDHQLSDLNKAGLIIQNWFPKAKIEIFYADRDGNKLRFRPIPLMHNLKEVK